MSRRDTIATRVFVGMIWSLATGAAIAEVIERSGTFNGVSIDYRVVLPDGYSSTQAYPVILHFAGGPQTLQIVERSLEADWRRNAEARGFVVISPAAPSEGLFFGGGDAAFPDFIEQIYSDHVVLGDKLHVTGHSNGGLSAFHIASKFPEFFLSVTGYPGLLSSRNAGPIDALRPLCIFMHVGDQDPSWREAMRRQADELEGAGFRIEYTLEENQTHRLDTSRAALAERLFDEIEKSRSTCNRER